MTVGTYAPRCFVHPDRYGVKKSQSNLWAVLHTSEGPEGENAAENLCGYMGQPGDRSNGRGGYYGSSYHAVFDTDRIIPAVPYDVVSYSAGGGNARGIHGCFPGRANQTRAQWLDPVSRAMIRQAAAWLLDLEHSFGIPVGIKMSVGDMQAYKKGLGDHYTVTQAFRKSTHTDVGAGFPWDVLAQDIANLRNPLPPPTIPPQEDDDMPKIAYIMKPPPERAGKPWLYVCDADVREATTFDLEQPGVPTKDLGTVNPAWRVEQYDRALARAMHQSGATS